MLIATREEQKDTSEKMQDLGLMPLWQRELDVIKDDSKVLLSLGLFSFSLLLVITNFLNVVIAFLLCVLAFVASKLLKPNMLYRHIEWPVIVLLGAMIPIGDALYDSGLTNSCNRYSNSINSIWFSRHFNYFNGCNNVFIRCY